jgi:cyclopropane fatty-acyl-phospholipid synthase-like methyltransferase
MSQEQYFPQVFIPQNLEHAKEIILSTDPTGEKWRRETDETATALFQSFEKAQLQLTDQSILLDYGCGIGRMAKKIIELSGCTVLGADISPEMLRYSWEYVRSDRFIACPQNRLGNLTWQGLRVDAAIAVWTLQHCLNPAEDIALVHEILKPNGLFFVVNKFDRYVPVTPNSNFARWYNDGIDVLKCISEKFELVESVSGLGEARSEYYRTYRKK